jgi:hypothetical protein
LLIKWNAGTETNGVFNGLQSILASTFLLSLSVRASFPTVMINLAMDLDNYLEKSLTCMSLVLEFHLSQPEDKKRRQS